MVVQNSYTSTLEAKYEGRLESGRLNSDIASTVAKDLLGAGFGRVATLKGIDSDELYMAKSTQAQFVQDVDQTSGNFTGNLTIDGTSNALSVVFNSSQTQTMLDIETAIELLTGVASATISDANDRTMTIAFEDGSSGFFDTLAASGVAFTETNSDSNAFEGITIQTERQPADGQVGAGYAFEDQTPMAKKGRVDVRSEDDLNPGDQVFVRIVEESNSDQKFGMLKSAAGSAPIKAQLWAAASVYRGAAAGGIVTLEINLP